LRWPSLVRAPRRVFVELQRVRVVHGIDGAVLENERDGGAGRIKSFRS
jgi:hypothetical protein